MRPTQLDYGTGKNPADKLQKIGRKNQLIEKAIAEQVAEEQKQKEAQDYMATQQRSFGTTNAATFHGNHDLCQNVIGRKVMRTQDG